jgi:hypothetical protein
VFGDRSAPDWVSTYATCAGQFETIEIVVEERQFFVVRVAYDHGSSALNAPSCGLGKPLLVPPRKDGLVVPPEPIVVVFNRVRRICINQVTGTSAFHDDLEIRT